MSEGASAVVPVGIDHDTSAPALTSPIEGNKPGAWKTDKDTLLHSEVS